MRILYDKGFSKEDRTAYKRFINLNVILSMRSLLMGMKETGAEIHPDHAQILDLLISHSSLLEQVIFLLLWRYFFFTLIFRLSPLNWELVLNDFGVMRLSKLFSKSIIANSRFTLFYSGFLLILLTFR